jgi:chromosome partitioning protein
MIICLANSKGGQGKSTAAIHLAAFFQKQAATLLVDSDHVRASLAWGREGKLPFDVVDESDQEAAMRRRRYDHVVLDTPGSIDPRGLKELAAGCNLIVLPAIPEAIAMDGLAYTLHHLKDTKADCRVLLNRVRHNRPKEAIELRAALDAMGAKVFKAEIPDLAAFDKAAAQGVVVCDVNDPRALRAWNAFEALGEEILYGRE